MNDRLKRERKRTLLSIFIQNAIYNLNNILQRYNYPWIHGSFLTELKAPGRRKRTGELQAAHCVIITHKPHVCKPNTIYWRVFI
jgi:hypothetical protein